MVGKLILGRACHIGIARAINRNCIGNVVSISPQVGGVNQCITRRVKLGNKGVDVTLHWFPGRDSGWWGNWWIRLACDIGIAGVSTAMA